VKTGKSVQRQAAPKRRSRLTVDEYVAEVPPPAQQMLKELRAVIRSALPSDAAEIISYGMPAFRRDVVLVWYAAFADHCSLFPGASIIERFKNETTSLKTSKGTVQFPLGQPLPKALIKRIIKARLAERETKTQRSSATRMV
jgi:uncharacterized protein YdhG (YjbR/CyaY superfamily)